MLANLIKKATLLTGTFVHFFVRYQICLNIRCNIFLYSEKKLLAQHMKLWHSESGLQCQRTNHLFNLLAGYREVLKNLMFQDHRFLPSFIVLSVVANVSLFPLFFTPFENILKVCLSLSLKTLSFNKELSSLKCSKFYIKV